MFVRVSFWTAAILVALTGARAADDVIDDTSTRVAGTVEIPADVEGFTGRTLELQMYKIHPLLADAPADLVDTATIADFGHVRGALTRKTFEIGDGGRIEADKMYYLTCFVVDGGTRTHIGEPPDKNLCKVLTLGNPRSASFILRPVR